LVMVPHTNGPKNPVPNLVFQKKESCTSFGFENQI
jgi:hypothetical protein